MESVGVLGAEPPAFSTDEARELARRLFGVAGGCAPLVSERDQNFLVSEPSGVAWVLKISNAAEDRAVVAMEVAAVEHIHAVDPGLPVPLPRGSMGGEAIAVTEGPGGLHLVRLLPRLPGRTPRPDELDDAALRQLGMVVARLGVALRGFFHPAAGRPIEWDLKHLPALAEHAAAVTDPARRALLDDVLHRFDVRVAPVLPSLRAQVIHNDVTLDNLLLDDAGRVSGIVDFGDMAHTALVFDVPATLQSLVRERGGIAAVAEAFLAGYASVTPFERQEAELLGDMLAARMAQTILISAWRMPRHPDNAYITGWAEPAWHLLEEMRATGFDAAGESLARAALRGGSSPSSAALPALPGEEELLRRRRAVLGSALSPLTYRRPLYLVRGEGAWMYDAQGRAYLDAYNNVPVVGHAHPRVADAIARQAALLNTNTRYLHPFVVELAERIVASMPPGLDTVMFVNSGSEANDLAWRLATTATGATGGLVTEWAYHGVTDVIAALSPSEWPSGRQPDHVETVPAPDTFRAAAGDSGGAAAAARATMEAAIERLAARGLRPAALYLDGFFTADGIFAPDPAVVAASIGAARAAGALFVADEVQSGHGRSGDGLWRFPAWGVVPDLVTLGKPMGNGHPIAAVVTRAEVVDRFAAETEFFSTFGGNPVACAAALAVLDVLGDEDLIGNAARTGDLLGSGLAELRGRWSVIGDVRGRGLMRGVELVRPGTSEPDGALAAAVRDEMRERGVLIGTTRREGNVLKIRPPLCIGSAQAGLIVETLHAALTEVAGAP
jgi:4-aminobutyrate aminotransferase-like enzyme